MFKEMFKILKNLLFREARRIAADASLFTLLVLAPLAYVTIYGFAYINKKEVNVPLLVIDQDKSALSRLLIRDLDVHQSVSVHCTDDNIETALHKVNSGSFTGVLLIPEDLERNAKSGLHSFLKIYVNTTRFLPANDINKALTEIILTLSGGIKLKFFQTRGYSYQQAVEMSQPLSGEVKNMFNPADTYGEFILPGLMILIMHQILLIAFTMALVGEREDQSMHNLLAAAHGNPFYALKGKALYYLLLFGAYVPVIYVLHYRMFNLHTKGSLWLVWLISLLAIAAILSLAAFLSTFFKTRLGTLQILAFFSYPVFFVSGYSWPFNSLPYPLQCLGNLLPIKPYLAAYIRTSMMDAGFWDVAPEILHILLLTTIFSLFGVWNMQRVAKAELMRMSKPA